jgi:hypothetical protein
LKNFFDFHSDFIGAQRYAGSQNREILEIALPQTFFFLFFCQKTDDDLILNFVNSLKNFFDFHSDFIGARRHACSWNRGVVEIVFPQTFSFFLSAKKPMMIYF